MKIINLLPKEKQREFYYRKVLRSLLVMSAAAFMSFVLVSLFQLGSRMYIEREIKNLYADIESIKAVSNKQENAQLKKHIQDLNSQITDFNNLSKDAPRWSKVLRGFSRLVPENVFIQNFSVDITKRQITVNGFAPKRESVIALYNNIVADSAHFTNVDYPLENVSKPTDVQFHFTFTVQEGVLL